MFTAKVDGTNHVLRKAFCRFVAYRTLWYKVKELLGFGPLSPANLRWYFSLNFWSPAKLRPYIFWTLFVPKTWRAAAPIQLFWTEFYSTTRQYTFLQFPHSFLQVYLYFLTSSKIKLRAPIARIRPRLWRSAWAEFPFSAATCQPFVVSIFLLFSSGIKDNGYALMKIVSQDAWSYSEPQISDTLVRLRMWRLRRMGRVEFMTKAGYWITPPLFFLLNAISEPQTSIKVVSNHVCGASSRSNIAYFGIDRQP